MAIQSGDDQTERWPGLSWEKWGETFTTLQLWTQIVGKIRLALTPWTNHSWHVTLHLTARGLGTPPLYLGDRAFELEFDFVAHELVLRISDGTVERAPLETCSVADFYRKLMNLLARHGLSVRLNTRPNEMAEAIPFEEDVTHSLYEPEGAARLWQGLRQADRVFKIFRARFCGKCSPVHFFWGSFDLAVTRFSGRPAPLHPGGVPHLSDAVTREAYSHEVSSAGFWPGGPALPEPVFYSYAYPTPEKFAEWPVRPAAAYYHATLREFVLPYEAVRTAADPDAMLLEFLQDTYDAASTLGDWDRAAFEEHPPRVA